MTLINSHNNDLNTIDEITDSFDELDKYIEQENKSAIARLIDKYHPSDLANYLDISKDKYLRYILTFFSEMINPETLTWVNLSTKLKIYDHIGPKRISKAIETLDIEDVTEIIQDLDSDVQDELLKLVNSKIAQQIYEKLSYPEHTAGRIMKKSFIAFSLNSTIKEAVYELKTNKTNKASEECHENNT